MFATILLLGVKGVTAVAVAALFAGGYLGYSYGSKVQKTVTQAAQAAAKDAGAAAQNVAKKL